MFFIIRYFESALSCASSDLENWKMVSEISMNCDFWLLSVRITQKLIFLRHRSGESGDELMRCMLVSTVSKMSVSRVVPFWAYISHVC